MNVSIYLLKKSYKISKNENKIHGNLQITNKIFEKKLYTFNRTHTYLQEKKTNYIDYTNLTTNNIDAHEIT